jgi:cell division protein FtsQ
MNTVAAPLDVRLMNITVAVLLSVFAALCVAAAARWVSRSSQFDIQNITVVGDTRHNNALTLRANVAPRISGTFFTVDLARVRAAFESAPWVRRAVVHREFPNRLRVALQEHRAVAFWGGEGELRLINNYGEVFEANVDEVDQDSLPTLSGPEGQAGEVLAMFQALAPQFAEMQIPVEKLELSGRGSWSVQLATDATLELGRGSVEEVKARTHRFLTTLTQIVTRYSRQPSAIESADLRHENGYAIRLRGVTTQTVGEAKSQ